MQVEIYSCCGLYSDKTDSIIELKPRSIMVLAFIYYTYM